MAEPKSTTPFRYGFYIDRWLDERNKRAVRTDWIMYEHSLINEPQVAFGLCHIGIQCDESMRVRCIFLAGESVASVCDIGIQCEKTYTRDFREATACGPKYLADCFNIPSSIQENNMAVSSELDGEFRSIMDGDYIELDDLVIEFGEGKQECSLLQSV